MNKMLPIDAMSYVWSNLPLTKLLTLNQLSKEYSVAMQSNMFWKRVLTIWRKTLCLTDGAVLLNLD